MKLCREICEKCNQNHTVSYEEHNQMYNFNKAWDQGVCKCFHNALQYWINFSMYGKDSEEYMENMVKPTCIFWLEHLMKNE